LEEYEFLYLIAGGLLLFSILNWFLKKPSILTKRRIRQTFYAVWMFVFAIFYNLNDLSKVTIQADKVLFPLELWIFFWYFIVFALVGIVFDVFILSGREIKSVKRDGVDFEEGLEVLTTQDNIIEIYEEKIDAEHEILQDIGRYTSHVKELIENLVFEKNNGKQFSLIEEMENIIENYYRLQQRRYSFKVLMVGDDLTYGNIKRNLE